jgi:metal-responsive CopG/Arc/MetJ family transcriptional regulator
MPDSLERVKSMILGGNMKIAISIDDEILREADEEAGRMGLSRSRLLAMAVGEFLRRQRQEQMLRSNDTEPAEKSL